MAAHCEVAGGEYKENQQFVMRLLSEEMVLCILQWLPPSDLMSARLVCRDWLRVADDDALWRRIVGSKWQPLPTDEAEVRAMGLPVDCRGLYLYKERCDRYWSERVTLKWKQLEDPLQERQTDQFVLSVINEYVYVFGGRVSEALASNHLWIYSIKRGKKLRGVVLKPHNWQAVWPDVRINAAGAVVNNRYLYILGGNSNELLNDLWVFDTETQKWTEVEATGDPPTPRWTHSLTSVGTRLFVFGGWADNCNFNDLYILDTETRIWTKGDMQGDIPPPLGCHTASLVGKYIFIYGGDDTRGHIYSDIYRLDTESLYIEKLAVKGVPERRESHSDVVIGNVILYYGGQQPTEDKGDVPYDERARTREANVAVFNTDTLSWHHPNIKGNPTDLGWHSLSFMGNAVQVWFGFSRNHPTTKRRIGILALDPPLFVEEEKSEGTKGKSCSLQ